jgi:hypothetical protein
MNDKSDMNIKWDRKTIVTAIAIVLAVVILVVIVGCCRKDQDGDQKVEQPPEQKVEQPPVDQQKKEPFTMIVGGTSQQDGIGAVTGKFMATTGTTYGDAEEALMKAGTFDYVDKVPGQKTISLAAAGHDDKEVSPLDQQMMNHNEVQRIANPDGRNYCTHEEHGKIAQMVNGNGGQVNMFRRGMQKSLKMKLDPLGTKVVIDEKYLPEKDRHSDLVLAGNVIPTKGYEVHVERLGEDLKGFSWTEINKVQKQKKDAGIRKGVGTAGAEAIDLSNIVVERPDDEGVEVRSDKIEQIVEGFGRYGKAVRGNVLL